MQFNQINKDRGGVNTPSLHPELKEYKIMSSKYSDLDAHTIEERISLIEEIISRDCQELNEAKPIELEKLERMLDELRRLK